MKRWKWNEIEICSTSATMEACHIQDSPVAGNHYAPFPRTSQNNPGKRPQTARASGRIMYDDDDDDNVADDDVEDEDDVEDDEVQEEDEVQEDDVEDDEVEEDEKDEGEDDSAEDEVEDDKVEDDDVEEEEEDDDEDDIVEEDDEKDDNVDVAEDEVELDDVEDDEVKGEVMMLRMMLYLRCAPVAVVRVLLPRAQMLQLLSQSHRCSFEQHRQAFSFHGNGCRNKRTVGK